MSQTGAIALLNAVAAGVATKFDTKLADGFGAFLVASIPKGGDTCAAGLLLPPSPLTPPGIPCDVHPSETGARLLSQAVIKAAKSGNNN